VRLLALLACAGCSFVFVHGPEVGSTSCTTSEVLPALDAAAAIGAFVGLAFDGMAINDHARGDGQIGTPIAIGTGLLIGGILYTVSAVGGHHDASACRARQPAATQP
jgi:hypothetical protein